ncbi:hypothetical protein F511_43006 [Dorcoceras hygrometricum]|uniref:Uncharacterized protein n=1 Tax=Dorcoceras hygrometricum TaxID=472368 RepID=A0A2Z7AX76_9LAMI|nr:hypothetical protein F511_43006 [Dorcoceras hygrometricum]
MLAEGSDKPRERKPETHLQLVDVKGVKAPRRTMSPLLRAGQDYFKLVEHPPFFLMKEMSDDLRLEDFSSYQGALEDPSSA